MVFPVVLAVGALALYFLTKPKKSDSDIYGKDSEPKKESSGVQEEIKKLDEIREKEKTQKLLFSEKNSDGYIRVTRNNGDKKSIAFIDNSKVKPTYFMIKKQLPSKSEENLVKEKIESIIKNHEDQKLKNKSTRKEKLNEEKKTKTKLTNKELKEKLDKVLQFHKKSNQFQKDGKYAYFHMSRLDSSTWFRFGNITKSGNVVFYDYVNQKEDKKIGKVLQDFKYVNYKPTKEKTYRIMINFSGYAYFLDLDKKPLTEKERNKENYDSIMNS